MALRRQERPHPALRRKVARRLGYVALCLVTVALGVSGLVWRRAATSDRRLVAEAHAIWLRTGFHNMTRHERETVWRLAARATEILGPDRRVQDLSGVERDLVEEAVRDGLVGVGD